MGLKNFEVTHNHTSWNITRYLRVVQRDTYIHYAVRIKAFIRRNKDAFWRLISRFEGQKGRSLFRNAPPSFQYWMWC